MQAMDLQRAAFYAGADLRELAEQARQFTLDRPENPLLAIYAETTRAILEHIDHGVHQKPG